MVGTNAIESPIKNEQQTLLPSDAAVVINDDEDRGNLNQAPRRYAIFTMLPLFMGYAALVTIQGKLKAQIGIPNNGSHESYLYGFAVSFLYMGNLVFRLLHNIIFSTLRPRHRVVVAYSVMALANFIIAMVYYVAECKDITWIYVAYALGGVGVGTFESNLISCITPLGHATKSWAQLGISFGFNGVSIGSFILFACFPHMPALEMGVYLFIAAANIAGIAFFIIMIPDIQFAASDRSIKKFFEDICMFREWILLIAPFAFALMIDMFGVSLFSAEPLYIYDKDQLPLWKGATKTIPVDVFRVIYNTCSLIGDASGRKLAYWTPRMLHPCLFLVLTAIGGALVLSKITIIAPIGMLLVMFANGSVYAHTTKYIDNIIGHRFNLIALSFWLFIGDVGSFAAANVVNLIKVHIGSVA